MLLSPQTSGQSCTYGSECGLPKSVCNTSQKCACNSIAGYEDIIGPNDRETCTKSLGRLHLIKTSFVALLEGKEYS